MNRSRILSLSLALVLLAATPVALSAEIPAWIGGEYAEETGRPLWVSLEEAAPNGEMNWDLLPAGTQSSLKRELDRSRRLYETKGKSPAEDPCMTYLIIDDQRPQWLNPPRTPYEISRFSELIVSGKVSTQASGFFQGVASTLFEIEVDSLLKSPSGIRPFRTLRVVYGGVTLLMEGGSYCVRPRGGEDIPQEGDSVLLIFEQAPDFRAPFVPLLDDQLFYRLPSGKTSVTDYFPEIFYSDLLSSLEEALESSLP
ncbi:MAG: hypothetical protein AAF481_06780 [Acidobacteriota bacterium]